MISRAVVFSCRLLAISLGLGCRRDAEPRITVTEESLAIQVTKVAGGITIENQSGGDCIVYVRSPDGSASARSIQRQHGVLAIPVAG